MHITVHIGMPKTGTTTLQESFRQSYDFLAQHGVLYPVVPDLGNNHFFLGAILSCDPGGIRA